MKIVVELNAAQTERLQAIGTSLGVNAEELAQAAMADLLSAGADDFEAAASPGASEESRTVSALGHMRSSGPPRPAGPAGKVIIRLAWPAVSGLTSNVLAQCRKRLGP